MISRTHSIKAGNNAVVEAGAVAVLQPGAKVAIGDKRYLVTDAHTLMQYQNSDDITAAGELVDFVGTFVTSPRTIERAVIMPYSFDPDFNGVKRFERTQEGYNLFSTDPIKVPPHSAETVSFGVVVQVPEGYRGKVVPLGEWRDLISLGFYVHSRKPARLMLRLFNPTPDPVSIPGRVWLAQFQLEQVPILGIIQVPVDELSQYKRM